MLRCADDIDAVALLSVERVLRFTQNGSARVVGVGLPHSRGLT